MTKYLPFMYDEQGFYTNQKCFIIVGNDIEYLTTFLNSKLFKLCFRDNFPELLGGTRELSKVFFEKLLIPLISKKEQEVFKVLLYTINSRAKKNQKFDDIENEIDLLFYDLFSLTSEEINIVQAVKIVAEKEFKVDED
jgi:hypothetical protein